MQQTEWGPRTEAIAACGVGGIAMGFAVVMLVTDAPGRLLIGTAALGLVIFAGFSFRARPRLAITPDGLAIRGWWRKTGRRYISLPAR